MTKWMWITRSQFVCSVTGFNLFHWISIFNTQFLPTNSVNFFKLGNHSIRGWGMLDNLSYSVNWNTSKIDRNSQLLKISKKKLKFKIMIKSIITANSLQMIRAHFDSFFHTSARLVKLSLQKLKLSHQNLNHKYSRYECRSFKILVIFFRLVYVLKYFLWHLFLMKKSGELQWVFGIVTTMRVSVWQGSYYFFCAASFYHIYFVCLFVNVFVHTTV